MSATTVAQPLVIERLSKQYGATPALREVNLSVAAGTITGLLGPNGAGKTTLLRILCGLAFADSGSAFVAGYSVGDARARAQIGYAPEVVTLPRGPTLDEFLVFHARLAGIPNCDVAGRVRALVERLGLGEVHAREAATISKGMRRRVGLAHALLADPAVLLLDEPGADLDPVARRELELLLQEERGRGKAILLSSHLLLETEPLLDQVAMLHRGELLAHGAVAQLIPTRHIVEIVLSDFGSPLREATAHLLPVFHEKEGRMTVATNDPELVRELPRLLENAGVRYEAVTMRRPNLRDLFFTLLGDRSS